MIRAPARGASRGRRSADRRHHGAMVDRADVIVVGAGVQGASLAFHLARRGADVLVLERSSIGAGATGRSSGFVERWEDGFRFRDAVL